MAAAAWSWVEKMLQEHQRTSAPSAVSVSISTAVCTVMCRDPAILAPCGPQQQSRQPHAGRRAAVGCLHACDI
jgi:hypothetical protein